MNNLFNNVDEEKTFYDLLATRKYKEVNEEKNTYISEIEEDINKCQEIFQENGAKTNFIADILAIQDKEFYQNIGEPGYNGE